MLWTTMPDLVAAAVCGFSSLRRVVSTFQHDVESTVNLAPWAGPLSSGFLCEGNRSMYSVMSPLPQR